MKGHQKDNICLIKTELFVVEIPRKHLLLQCVAIFLHQEEKVKDVWMFNLYGPFKRKNAGYNSQSEAMTVFCTCFILQHQWLFTLIHIYTARSQSTVFGQDEIISLHK